MRFASASNWRSRTFQPTRVNSLPLRQNYDFLLGYGVALVCDRTAARSDRQQGGYRSNDHRSASSSIRACIVMARSSSDGACASGSRAMTSRQASSIWRGWYRSLAEKPDNLFTHGRSMHPLGRRGPTAIIFLMIIISSAAGPARVAAPMAGAINAGSPR